MNTRHITPKRTLIALVLMLCAHGAPAATTRADFRNDTAVTHGFLFADNPTDLQFLGLEFRNAMNGTWNLDIASPAIMGFSGPAVQPSAGRLRLTFEYLVPQVTFQWAEVLFDGVNYAVQASGTLAYDASQNGNNRWAGTGVFSQSNSTYIDNYFGGPAGAAVPLPHSVVLLLSAVAFMGFSRRGDLAAAATSPA